MSSSLSKKSQHIFSPIEITFHGTSRKKLAWFYQLLVAELVNEPDRAKEVAEILKPWKLDHDVPRLERINTCLSKHPLLVKAFNVMLNSDVTCIRLEVPAEQDEEIKFYTKFGEFRQYYRYNQYPDEETLTRQFLTKQVEMKAIDKGQYAEVLYAMSKYENKHSQYAFRAKDFMTYCQKLVTFYVYSNHWKKFLACTDEYYKMKAKKEKTNKREKTQISTVQEEEVKLSASKELLEKLCVMLANSENFDLLLELKHHVRYIGKLVCEVKLLASHPFKAPQQEQQE